MDDTEIIELFFERSETAVSALATKYGGTLLKIAENVLHNRQDAEECVNDTYMGVWDAIPPQRPNSLTAFVCRIARNISINRYRRDSFRKRGGAYDVCFDELQECISSTETVESRFAEKELSEFIDDFLDTLDKKNRMIFVRRYFYMDQFGDIASAAGMSEGTVRTRLSRLRGKLKDFLESRGGERMNLMEAVGGISDRHIAEFADVKPRVKHEALRSWIASAAACLVLIIGLGVGVRILGLFSGINAGMPCVVINDKVYIYDDVFKKELPEEYVVIGYVTSDKKADKDKNGYSNSCKLGQLIYQDPNSPDEVYVYTTLFAGKKYNYVRFVESGKREAETAEDM